MYRRVVTLFFPAVLILAEYIVRSENSAEPVKFFAPTVTSLALGFLFPLLSVEDTTPEGFQVDGCQISTSNGADEDVAKIAVIFLFVFTIAWMVFLGAATKAGGPENPTLFGFPTLAYSALTYLLSASLNEVKESK